MNDRNTHDNPNTLNSHSSIFGSAPSGEHGRHLHRKYLTILGIVFGIGLCVTSVLYLSNGNVWGLITGLFAIALLKFVWGMRNRKE